MFVSHYTLERLEVTKKKKSEKPKFKPQILKGDCLEILPTLKKGSVQCCVTSPPYWGLRDYDHPKQIGAESSPELYVKNLVANACTD